MPRPCLASAPSPRFCFAWDPFLVSRKTIRGACQDMAAVMHGNRPRPEVIAGMAVIRPGPLSPPIKEAATGADGPRLMLKLTPGEGWNSSRDARQPSGSDQQAAVGRPGAGGYGATPSAPYWDQSPGRYGYPDTNGNYANPGYTMPSTVQPPYLYGRQFGEFPPLEGKERTPGAESLPSQAPPPRQAPVASGYGARLTSRLRLQHTAALLHGKRRALTVTVHRLTSKLRLQHTGTAAHTARRLEGRALSRALGVCQAIAFTEYRTGLASQVCTGGEMGIRGRKLCGMPSAAKHLK